MTGDGSFAIGSRVWPGTSKVLEEMGELTQVLGKLIATGGDRQHWDGDLMPRLIEELGDLVAALTFFGLHNLSDENQDTVLERSEVKFELFEKWHATKTSAVRSPSTNG